MSTPQKLSIHQLKMDFLNNPNRETLANLLGALKESAVYLPVSIQMDKDDQEKFLKGKKGDMIQTEHDMKMKPDVLKDKDGNLFLPIFSETAQIPSDYAQKFSKIQFPTIQCIQMAHAIPNLSGLVLDAFTESFAMPFDVADVLLNIPLTPID